MHWPDKMREFDYTALLIYVFIDLPFKAAYRALERLRGRKDKRK